MANSKIEWTEKTWNPVTGCSKISPGCKNCYAETMFNRLSQMDSPDNVYKGRKFTDVGTHAEKIKEIVHWKKPRMIFVNSMSDLFHKDVPFEFIEQCLDVMVTNPRHTYQILTKRPDRLLEFSEWQEKRIVESGYGDGFRFPDFIWIGVSVENQEQADKRIPILLQVPAKVRWISAEPLLEPIDFSPYLYYVTQKDLEDNNEQRRNFISSSDKRKVADFGGGGNPKSQGEEDRTPNFKGLSTSKKNDFRDQDSYGFTPIDMEKIQRGDTNGDANESQERGKIGQPTGESGVNDGFSERSSRIRDIEEGKSFEPEGGNELNGKNKGFRNSKNKSNEEIREEIKSDSRNIRSSIPNNKQDLQRREAIHQIIVGGESGPKKRPFDCDWARSLRDQCKAAGVPFFMKQVDKVRPIPEDLFVREFPL